MYNFYLRFANKQIIIKQILEDGNLADVFPNGKRLSSPLQIKYVDVALLLTNFLPNFTSQLLLSV